MKSNELIEKAKEFENTIVNLTEQVRDFRKQLENAEADEDKKFKRVEYNQTYYYIDAAVNGEFVVYASKEINTLVDSRRYCNNNYFLTQERAQEVADKLNTIMCTERIRDEHPEFDIRIKWTADTPSIKTALEFNKLLKNKKEAQTK